jgi:hypothetical protein
MQRLLVVVTVSMPLGMSVAISCKKIFVADVYYKNTLFEMCNSIPGPYILNRIEVSTLDSQPSLEKRMSMRFVSVVFLLLGLCRAYLIRLHGRRLPPETGADRELRSKRRLSDDTGLMLVNVSHSFFRRSLSDITVVQFRFMNRLINGTVKSIRSLGLGRIYISGSCAPAGDAFTSTNGTFAVSYTHGVFVANIFFYHLGLQMEMRPFVAMDTRGSEGVSGLRVNGTIEDSNVPYPTGTSTDSTSIYQTSLKRLDRFPSARCDEFDKMDSTRLNSVLTPDGSHPTAVKQRQQMGQRDLNSVLDVMVVYTPSAQAEAGGSLHSLQASVDLAIELVWPRLGSFCVFLWIFSKSCFCV